MKKTEKRKTVTFDCDPKVWERIKEISNEEGYKLAFFIGKILKDFIEEKEKFLI